MTKQRAEKRQIVINAASNASQMVAKVVVLFLVSPILVHGLGDTRFGIWMFANSIVAYLALGQFGVAQAVIRFVAQCDGLRDDDRMNRVFSTGSVFFLCVGMVVSTVVVVVSWCWDRPFHVDFDLAPEVRWLLILLGGTLGVSIAASGPRALLAGLGRFPAINAVGVACLVLRNVLLVAAIWNGGGLVAVGAILFGMSVVQGICYLLLAHSFLPQLAFSTRNVDSETFHAVLIYGANIFVASLATIVITQSAVVVIGMFLNPDAITYYSIGASLKDHAVTMVAALVFVITPAVSKWDATGDLSAVRALFHDAIRFALYIAAPVCVGLLTLGHSFISLWMGPRYAAVSFATLSILAGPLLLAPLYLVTSRILEGMGNARVLAVITASQAALTVILSAALARPYGIEGVAWGVSLALVATVPILVLVTCRSLQVNMLSLIWRSSWGPLLGIAVAAPVWVLATHYFRPTSWAVFLMVGMLGMVPYTMVVISLEPQARRLSAHAFGRLRGETA